MKTTPAENYLRLLQKRIVKDTADAIAARQRLDETLRIVAAKTGEVLCRIAEIRVIQEATAEAFGVPVGVMQSQRKPKGEAEARQSAMWLCRKLTKRSHVEIGECFGGRDPGTVIWAVDAIDDRLANPRETQLRAILGDLQARLPVLLQTAAQARISGLKEAA